MQPPQSNKIRFKINIEIVAPYRKKNNVNVTMTAEELYQCIGKYTVKYGPPVNMSEADTTTTLMNFYKKDNVGLYEINLTYSKLEVVGETHHKEFTRSSPPTAPPVENVVHPAPIKTLLDAGLIIPVNDYGSYWKRNY